MWRGHFCSTAGPTPGRSSADSSRGRARAIPWNPNRRAHKASPRSRKTFGRPRATTANLKDAYRFSHTRAPSRTIPEGSGRHPANLLFRRAMIQAMRSRRIQQWRRPTFVEMTTTRRFKSPSPGRRIPTIASNAQFTPSRPPAPMSVQDHRTWRGDERHDVLLRTLREEEWCHGLERSRVTT